tara:strand:+ start:357 stop:566 length:210 start_codon:yes stop_codon:yes gene_type:complete
MTDLNQKKSLKQKYKRDDIKERVASDMGFDSYSELKFRNRRKVKKELKNRMKKELATTENTGLYTINTK